MSKPIPQLKGPAMIARDLVKGHELDVLIRPKTCALFAFTLRGWANERRGMLDADTWDDLEQIEAVASAYLKMRSSPRDKKTVVTTSPKLTSAEKIDGVKEVRVSEAARIVGVSRQEIDRRCRRRKNPLPFRKDERGHRWIRLENLVVGND